MMDDCTIVPDKKKKKDNYKSEMPGYVRLEEFFSFAALNGLAAEEGTTMNDNDNAAGQNNNGFRFDQKPEAVSTYEKWFDNLVSLESSECVSVYKDHLKEKCIMTILNSTDEISFVCFMETIQEIVMYERYFIDFENVINKLKQRHQSASSSSSSSGSFQQQNKQPYKDCIIDALVLLYFMNKDWKYQSVATAVDFLNNYMRNRPVNDQKTEFIVFDFLFCLFTNETIGNTVLSIEFFDMLSYYFEDTTSSSAAAAEQTIFKKFMFHLITIWINRSIVMFTIMDQKHQQQQMQDKKKSSSESFDQNDSNMLHVISSLVEDFFLCSYISNQFIWRRIVEYIIYQNNNNHHINVKKDYFACYTNLFEYYVNYVYHFCEDIAKNLADVTFVDQKSKMLHSNTNDQPHQQQQQIPYFKHETNTVINHQHQQFVSKELSNLLKSCRFKHRDNSSSSTNLDKKADLSTIYDNVNIWMFLMYSFSENCAIYVFNERDGVTANDQMRNQNNKYITSLYLDSYINGIDATIGNNTSMCVSSSVSRMLRNSNKNLFYHFVICLTRFYKNSNHSDAYKKLRLLYSNIFDINATNEEFKTNLVHLYKIVNYCCEYMNSRYNNERRFHYNMHDMSYSLYLNQEFMDNINEHTKNKSNAKSSESLSESLRTDSFFNDILIKYTYHLMSVLLKSDIMHQTFSDNEHLYQQIQQQEKKNDFDDMIVKNEQRFVHHILRDYFMKDIKQTKRVFNIMIRLYNTYQHHHQNHVTSSLYSAECIIRKSYVYIVKILLYVFNIFQSLSSNHNNMYDTASTFLQTMTTYQDEVLLMTIKMKQLNQLNVFFANFMCQYKKLYKQHQQQQHIITHNRIHNYAIEYNEYNECCNIVKFMFDCFKSSDTKDIKSLFYFLDDNSNRCYHDIYALYNAISYLCNFSRYVDDYVRVTKHKINEICEFVRKYGSLDQTERLQSYDFLYNKYISNWDIIPLSIFYEMISSSIIHNNEPKCCFDRVIPSSLDKMHTRIIGHMIYNVNFNFIILLTKTDYMQHFIHDKMTQQHHKTNKNNINDLIDSIVCEMYDGIINKTLTLDNVINFDEHTNMIKWKYVQQQQQQQNNESSSSSNNDSRFLIKFMYMLYFLYRHCRDSSSISRNENELDVKEMIHIIEDSSNNNSSTTYRNRRYCAELSMYIYDHLVDPIIRTKQIVDVINEVDSIRYLLGSSVLRKWILNHESIDFLLSKIDSLFNDRLNINENHTIYRLLKSMTLSDMDSMYDLYNLCQLNYEMFSKVNVSLLESIEFGIDILDWLRMHPDDQDFKNGIEMALGVSEMDCPPELWISSSTDQSAAEAAAQHQTYGHIDEKVFSQLQFIRNYFHGVIFGSGSGSIHNNQEDCPLYRRQYKDFDEFSDAFASKLSVFEPCIIEYIRKISSILKPIVSLLEKSIVDDNNIMSASIERLIQFSNVSECSTKWVIHINNANLHRKIISLDSSLSYPLDDLSMSNYDSISSSSGSNSVLDNMDCCLSLESFELTSSGNKKKVLHSNDIEEFRTSVVLSKSNNMNLYIASLVKNFLKSIELIKQYATLIVSLHQQGHPRYSGIQDQSSLIRIEIPFNPADDSNNEYIMDLIKDIKQTYQEWVYFIYHELRELQHNNSSSSNRSIVIHVANFLSIHHINRILLTSCRKSIEEMLYLVVPHYYLTCCCSDATTEEESRLFMIESVEAITNQFRNDDHLLDQYKNVIIKWTEAMNHLFASVGWLDKNEAVIRNKQCQIENAYRCHYDSAKVVNTAMLDQFKEQHKISSLAIKMICSSVNEAAELYLYLVSVYAHIGQFPTRDRVIICNKHTTWETLYMFLMRCFGSVRNGGSQQKQQRLMLYTIVNAQVLPFNMQSACIKLCRRFQNDSNDSDTASSQGDSNVKLLFICAYDNGSSSSSNSSSNNYIYNQLHRSNRIVIPTIDIKLCREIVSILHGRDSISDGSIISSLCRTYLSESSTPYAPGKSFEIQSIQTNRYYRIPSYSVESFLNGITSTDRNNLLLDYSADYSVFHIDMYDTAPEKDINPFLFELVFLFGINDESDSTSSGLFFYNPSCTHICIELTDVYDQHASIEYAASSARSVAMLCPINVIKMSAETFRWLPNDIGIENHTKLMYVFKALYVLMQSNADLFPYDFIGEYDRMLNETMTDAVSDEVSSSMGQRIYDHLIRVYSKTSSSSDDITSLTSISYWSLWNFVNVLHTFLSKMHEPISPLNMIFMSQDDHHNPDVMLMKMKAEIVNFIIRTAKEYTVRQKKRTDNMVLVDRSLLMDKTKYIQDLTEIFVENSVDVSNDYNTIKKNNEKNENNNLILKQSIRPMIDSSELSTMIMAETVNVISLYGFDRNAEFFNRSYVELPFMNDGEHVYISIFQSNSEKPYIKYYLYYSGLEGRWCINSMIDPSNKNSVAMSKTVHIDGEWTATTARNISLVLSRNRFVTDHPGGYKGEAIEIYKAPPQQNKSAEDSIDLSPYYEAISGMYVRLPESDNVNGLPHFVKRLNPSINGNDTYHMYISYCTKTDCIQLCIGFSCEKRDGLEFFSNYMMTMSNIKLKTSKSVQDSIFHLIYKIGKAYNLDNNKSNSNSSNNQNEGNKLVVLYKTIRKEIESGVDSGAILNTPLTDAFEYIFINSHASWQIRLKNTFHISSKYGTSLKRICMPESEEIAYYNKRHYGKIFYIRLIEEKNFEDRHKDNHHMESSSSSNISNIIVSSNNEKDSTRLKMLEHIFQNDTMRWKDTDHKCIAFSNTHGSINLVACQPHSFKYELNPDVYSFFLKSGIRVFGISELEASFAKASAAAAASADSTVMNNVSAESMISQESYFKLLGDITEVHRDNDSAMQIVRSCGDYCLTLDNVMKIVAIITRLKNDIPVILMGECGCGKTSLVNFMAKWMGIRLIVKDIHGGTSEGDIRGIFDMAISESQRLQQTEEYMLLFLDEVNACAHMGLITDLILKQQRQNKRLRVISALNPYRTNRTTGELIYRVTPIQRNLVDFVFDFGSLNTLEESDYIHSMLLSSMRWDIVDLMLDMDLSVDQRRVRNMNNVAMIKCMLCNAQNYLRNIEGDNSVVSLRDIKRFIDIFNFFVDSVFERGIYYHGIRQSANASFVLKKGIYVPLAFILAVSFVYYYRLDTSEKRNGFWYSICNDNPDSSADGSSSISSSSIRNLSEIKFKIKSSLKPKPNQQQQQQKKDSTSVEEFYINEFHRLLSNSSSSFSLLSRCRKSIMSTKKRSGSSADAADHWSSSLLENENHQKKGDNHNNKEDRTMRDMSLYPSLFKNILEKEQYAFVFNTLCVESNIALNNPLCENLFVSIICILNRIPVFIVGKPGTSKTLSIQIISSNLQGKQSVNKYWTNFPSVHLFPYQCSPLSDSTSIQKQYDMARKYQQQHHSGTTSIGSASVLLLDEVGLAELSPEMPLKCLHGILAESAVSIVGLSNTKLDAAKMNRAVLVMRPDISYEDIENTARSITADSKNNNMSIDDDSVSGVGGAHAGKEEEEDKMVIDLSNSFSKKTISDDKPQLRYISAVSKAFHKIISTPQQPQHQPQNQRQMIDKFVGMRDFYFLLKQICCSYVNDNQQPQKNDHIITEDAILFAICRNFGGNESVRDIVIQETMKQLYVNDHVEQKNTFSKKVNNSVSLIRSNLNVFSSSNISSISDMNLKTTQQHNRFDHHRNNCRNLMVISENGLSFLAMHYLMGEISCKRHIIICSDFPEDKKSEYYLCRKMNEIKIAMSKGSHVVLINGEDLYESLYDVLNQRYLCKKDSISGSTIRFLRLAIGSKSSLCQVEDGFKMIVLVDQDEAYNRMSAPMLNRFEKQLLRPVDIIQSAVSATVSFNSKQQIMDVVICEMESWLKRIVEETSFESLSDIFCGLDHSIESSIHMCLTKVLYESAAAATTIDHLTNDNGGYSWVINKMKALFVQIAFTTSFALSETLRETEHNNNKRSKFYHNMDHVLCNNSSNGTTAKLKIVMTYSSIDDSINSQHDQKQANVINLSDVTSENEFEKAVSSFIIHSSHKVEEEVSSSSALLYISVEMNNVTSKQFQHAKFICSNAIATIPYDNRNLRDISIIFIVYLQRRHGSIVHFEPNAWDYWFVDDISNSNNTHKYKENSIMSQLTKELQSKESSSRLISMTLRELFDLNVIDFKRTVHECLYNACIRSISSVSDSLHVLSLYDKMYHWIVLSSNDNNNNASDKFYGLVLKVLDNKHNRRIAHRQNSLFLLPLHVYLSVTSKTYVNFLHSIEIAVREVVTAAIVSVIHHLNKYDNMIHTFCKSGFLEKKWMDTFVHFVEDQFCSNVKILDFTNASVSIGCNGTSTMMYPFSFLIHKHINDIIHHQHGISDADTYDLRYNLIRKEIELLLECMKDTTDATNVTNIYLFNDDNNTNSNYQAMIDLYMRDFCKMILINSSCIQISIQSIRMNHYEDDHYCDLLYSLIRLAFNQHHRDSKRVDILSVHLLYNTYEKDIQMIFKTVCYLEEIGLFDQSCISEMVTAAQSLSEYSNIIVSFVCGRFWYKTSEFISRILEMNNFSSSSSRSSKYIKSFISNLHRDIGRIAPKMREIIVSASLPSSEWLKIEFFKKVLYVLFIENDFAFVLSSYYAQRIIGNCLLNSIQIIQIIQNSSGNESLPLNNDNIILTKMFYDKLIAMIMTQFILKYTYCDKCGIPFNTNDDDDNHQSIKSSNNYCHKCNILLNSCVINVNNKYIAQVKLAAAAAAESSQSITQHKQQQQQNIDDIINIDILKNAEYADALQQSLEVKTSFWYDFLKSSVAASAATSTNSKQQQRHSISNKEESSDIIMNQDDSTNSKRNECMCSRVLKLLLIQTAIYMKECFDMFVLVDNSNSGDTCYDDKISSLITFGTYLHSKVFETTGYSNDNAYLSPTQRDPTNIQRSAKRRRIDIITDSDCSDDNSMISETLKSLQDDDQFVFEISYYFLETQRIIKKKHGKSSRYHALMLESLLSRSSSSDCISGITNKNVKFYLVRKTIKYNETFTKRLISSIERSDKRLDCVTMSLNERLDLHSTLQRKLMECFEEAAEERECCSYPLFETMMMEKTKKLLNQISMLQQQQQQQNHYRTMMLYYKLAAKLRVVLKKYALIIGSDTYPGVRYSHSIRASSIFTEFSDFFNALLMQFDYMKIYVLKQLMKSYGINTIFNIAMSSQTKRCEWIVVTSSDTDAAASDADAAVHYSIPASNHEMMSDNDHAATDKTSSSVRVCNDFSYLEKMIIITNVHFVSPFGPIIHDQDSCCRYNASIVVNSLNDLYAIIMRTKKKNDSQQQQHCDQLINQIISNGISSSSSTRNNRGSVLLQCLFMFISTQNVLKTDYLIHFEIVNEISDLLTKRLSSMDEGIPKEIKSLDRSMFIRPTVAIACIFWFMQNVDNSNDIQKQKVQEYIELFFPSNNNNNDSSSSDEFAIPTSTKNLCDIEKLILQIYLRLLFISFDRVPAAASSSEGHDWLISMITNLSIYKNNIMLTTNMDNKVLTDSTKWYECPQGHPYSIGNCGKAMQVSKCPTCDCDIGGSSHKLLENNRSLDNLPDSILDIILKSVEGYKMDIDDFVKLESIRNRFDNDKTSWCVIRILIHLSIHLHYIIFSDDPFTMGDLFITQNTNKNCYHLNSLIMKYFNMMKICMMNKHNNQQHHNDVATAAAATDDAIIDTSLEFVVKYGVTIQSVLHLMYNNVVDSSDVDKAVASVSNKRNDIIETEKYVMKHIKSIMHDLCLSDNNNSIIAQIISNCYYVKSDKSIDCLKAFIGEKYANSLLDDDNGLCSTSSSSINYGCNDNSIIIRDILLDDSSISSGGGVLYDFDDYKLNNFIRASALTTDDRASMLLSCFMRYESNLMHVKNVIPILKWHKKVFKMINDMSESSSSFCLTREKASSMRNIDLIDTYFRMMEQKTTRSSLKDERLITKRREKYISILDSFCDAFNMSFHLTKQNYLECQDNPFICDDDDQSIDLSGRKDPKNGERMSIYTPIVYSIPASSMGSLAESAAAATAAITDAASNATYALLNRLHNIQQRFFEELYRSNCFGKYVVCCSFDQESDRKYRSSCYTDIDILRSRYIHYEREKDLISNLFCFFNTTSTNAAFNMDKIAQNLYEKLVSGKEYLIHPTQNNSNHVLVIEPRFQYVGEANQNIFKRFQNVIKPHALTIDNDICEVIWNEINNSSSVINVNSSESKYFAISTLETIVVHILRLTSHLMGSKKSELSMQSLSNMPIHKYWNEYIHNNNNSMMMMTAASVSVSNHFVSIMEKNGILIGHICFLNDLIKNDGTIDQKQMIENQVRTLDPNRYGAKLSDHDAGLIETSAKENRAFYMTKMQTAFKDLIGYLQINEYDLKTSLYNFMYYLFDDEADQSQFEQVFPKSNSIALSNVMDVWHLVSAVCCC